MKKILIISFFYYPSSAVGARRIYNLKKYLSRHNMPTTILTVKKEHYPNIDETLDFDGSDVERTGYWRFLFKERNKEVKEGFFQGFVRRSIFLINSLLKKAMFPDEHFGWGSFAIARGLSLLQKQQFDFIIASGAPWTNFFIGEILSAITRVPLIIDYRDPWTSYDNTLYSSILIKKMSEWYESGLVTRAHKIIVNTAQSRDILIKKFGSRISLKTQIIRNGYDPNIFLKLESKLIDEISEPNGIFTLTHTGNLYGSRSISSLIVAVEKLKREGIISKENFKVITYGTFIGKDSREIQKYKLNDIFKEKSFIPYFDSLLELSNSTMNLLVVGTEHEAMIPAKLFDYLMVKRPIFCIGPLSSEVKDIILSNNRGGYADILDSNDIKISLNSFIDDFNQKKLNKALPQLEEFNIENQVKILIKMLN